jgi:hypothetical protein
MDEVGVGSAPACRQHSKTPVAGDLDRILRNETELNTGINQIIKSNPCSEAEHVPVGIQCSTFGR